MSRHRPKQEDSASQRNEQEDRGTLAAAEVKTKTAKEQWEETNKEIIGKSEAKKAAAAARSGRRKRQRRRGRTAERKEERSRS